MVDHRARGSYTVHAQLEARRQRASWALALQRVSFEIAQISFSCFAHMCKFTPLNVQNSQTRDARAPPSLRLPSQPHDDRGGDKTLGEDLACA